MAYARRDIRGGAVQTTITSDISSGATSIPIAASTGWPDGVAGPFYVVINPGDSNEEKVLCATRTTLSLAVTTRGADSSTAAAHSSGAKIYPVMVAVDADEANYAVSQTVGKVTTAGDLLAASGANAFARLAKGSNSTVLQVDSGGTQQYGTVTSAMIADGTIVNGDVSASAALALSKLATQADQTILGNVSGGAAVPIALTTTQVKTALALASTNISDFTEAAQDAAGAMATDGTGVTLTYSDGGATLTPELVDAVAGAGLTISSKVLAVGAGTGITVNANDIAITQTVINTGAASTTWTTTLGGTGAALGNAVVVKRWIRSGRLIQFWLHITLGTTTSLASDQTTILLPVAAADPGNIEQVIGTAHYTDGGSKYLGEVYIDHTNDTSNDRMRLWGHTQFGTSNILVALAGDSFFTWGTGSKMSIFGSYEAAS